MSAGHRQDWDRYWQNAGGVAVFDQFGENSGALQEFWAGFFRRAFKHPGSTTMLDMACGTGAVTSIAMQIAEETSRSEVTHFCLDYSAGALSELRRRVPAILPIASDATAVPCAGASFHLVASQFGLEYAGFGAFTEAARLLSADGIFCAVCHLDSGPIHRECLDNLDTAETLLDFLSLAKPAFETLFALDRGSGSRSAAEEAHQALAGAVGTVRDLIERKGSGTAGGMPALLFRDVTYMYNRRRNFFPKQVFDWLDLNSGEVTAYAGRMRSMTGAALDQSAIREIRQLLESAGLNCREPQTLRLGPDAAPGAWIVEAGKQQGLANP